MKSEGDERKWITPFAWVDDNGDLHLCCDRVCEELGMPKTEENLRIVETVLMNEMRRLLPPGAKIISRVTEHIGTHRKKAMQKLAREIKKRTWRQS